MIFLHAWTDMLWSALRRWLEDVLTRAWCLFLTFCLVGLVHQTCCLLWTWLLLATTLGMAIEFHLTNYGVHEPLIDAVRVLIGFLVCSIFICQGINSLIVWGRCCDLVPPFTLCWIIKFAFPWPFICGMWNVWINK
jgi:hypothetical protein